MERHHKFSIWMADRRWLVLIAQNYLAHKNAVKKHTYSQFKPFSRVG